MIRMIRYQAKHDRVAENERLIRAVYDEMARVAPRGVRYATYRQDDGVSFVHVIAYDDEAAREAFTALPAFKAFGTASTERFEAPPVIVEMSMLGSYGVKG